MRYKVIHDPQEGDEVVYVGIHALKWRHYWGVDPTIAVTRVDEPSYDELAEVNAELLEALKVLVKLLEDIGDPESDYLEVSKAQAVIAKEEGANG